MHVTYREQQVLQDLSQGYTSKEISDRLNISYHTVESHKKRLIEKLGARNTVQLVVKAIRGGLMILSLITFLYGFPLSGQSPVIVDIQSTEGGILIPRMTSV